MNKIEKTSAPSLWDLQQFYFQEAGENAWKKEEVPHYITSNPVMAQCYAEIVYALLTDLARQGQSSECVYLLELGAGSGRFAYHFLKQLEQLTRHQEKLSPFCYVLSDFAEKNLTFWTNHPRLQYYFKQGLADYALFDALHSESIELRYSGRSIRPESLKSPLVLVANYFFDTIPQDFYFVGNSQLYQCALKFQIPKDWKNLKPNAVIKQASVSEGSRQLLTAPPYKEPFLNELVYSYQNAFSADSYLLFPHQGLRALHRLRQHSSAGLLLLTADRGHHRIEQLEQATFPSFNTHGSFSYPVNYHVFKNYCARQQGLALFPIHRHQSLLIGSLLFFKSPATFPSTQNASKKWLQNYGPDDFFVLKQSLGKLLPHLSLKEILAYLRLSGYDARMFVQLQNQIKTQLPSISENGRWDLLQAIHRVWEMYYPIGEKKDLAFDLGLLLFELRFYTEALAYFDLSTKIYEPYPNLQYNRALCYYYSKDWEKAVALLENSIVSTHQASKELLAHIRKSISSKKMLLKN